ncbi:galactitol-1-phosphate 5-dehydrogenase [Oribacterium sp. WCC10]|uniref:galactitol-1-phosphate 5-dehydrogenase n=1 Tax=Oribacterium sp. WCC10 TaxID=1855343 RepID=UPI0008E594F2|nr:galactitol-1-phosphate 5-dehydrogenase [Oribacterium sp. WCC10]SFG25717.1 L-iditol 2-dehydrogenase [Oribacterium sp. WCC10]
MEMKAWKLDETGKINFYDDVPVPEPEAGEVLIKVNAAGICGSDVPRVYRDGAHNMPLVIGHEFSGQVEKIGANVDKGKLGKRMGIFPLIPCRKCPSCREKKYEMCSNYSYLGSRRDGGFSEYVTVPEWNLIELPEGVTCEQAAMLEPMAVSVHAMRQLPIEKTDSVLVCGAGTIGQLLVMFLLERGMENVYVAGNKDFQKKILLDMGLPEGHFYNIKDGDLHKWVMDKTLGSGVDAYFECVGRNETIADSVELVKAGGQVCLMGNPAGDMSFSKVNYWKILRKQLTLKGTWNSSYLGDDEDAVSDDWHYVMRKLSEGKIHPEKLITHRLRLNELEKGLLIMRDKTEDYVKIMVKF